MIGAVGPHSVAPKLGSAFSWPLILGFCFLAAAGRPNPSEGDLVTRGRRPWPARTLYRSMASLAEYADY